MPGFVQRALFHNIALKVVSLLLAIGLWLVVAHDPPAEVEMKVPLEFRNLSDTLEIDSVNFTEARVRLRGPSRVIHGLQAAEVRAEIDLSGAQPGERTFDLSRGQIHVPQDVEVVQIVPGQFHLSFDNRATRTVEVRPRVIGNFAGGMEVAQVIADPPSVTITGPRRRVDAVEAATTDPVDVSGAMTRATFMTQAYVPDPLIQVVHPTPVRVTVIMGRSESHNK